VPAEFRLRPPPPHLRSLDCRVVPSLARGLARSAVLTFWIRRACCVVAYRIDQPFAAARHRGGKGVCRPHEGTEDPKSSVQPTTSLADRQCRPCDSRWRIWASNGRLRRPNGEMSGANCILRTRFHRRIGASFATKRRVSPPPPNRRIILQPMKFAARDCAIARHDSIE